MNPCSTQGRPMPVLFRGVSHIAGRRIGWARRSQMRLETHWFAARVVSFLKHLTNFTNPVLKIQAQGTRQWPCCHMRDGRPLCRTPRQRRADTGFR